MHKKVYFLAGLSLLTLTCSLETVVGQTSVPLDSLLGIWTYDPNGPHADFVIYADRFMNVDGDQKPLNHLFQDGFLVVYHPDITDSLEIIKAQNDTLVFRKYGIETECYRWEH